MREKLQKVCLVCKDNLGMWCEETGKNTRKEHSGPGDKWERNACLIQVTDPSWMKVSNQFREHMIKEYGNYIPGQYKSSFIYWPK